MNVEEADCISWSHGSLMEKSGGRQLVEYNTVTRCSVKGIRDSLEMPLTRGLALSVSGSL